MATNCRLFVISQVQTDDEEGILRKQILDKLSDTSFNPMYLLFCSTKEGRGHIARHFGVSVHIDGKLFYNKLFTMLFVDIFCFFKRK